jgi:hypothetical protein
MREGGVVDGIRAVIPLDVVILVRNIRRSVTNQDRKLKFLPKFLIAVSE